jgi:hypothetical protein
VAQAVDVLAVRDVRDFLFDQAGTGGSDLIARDIQRNRDHGLPDFNTMRAAYGLRRLTSFAQITRNVSVQRKLRELYGNVNNIDSFVGAIAEDHVRGASVGPLVRAALADQFRRLRDGDKFFFRNTFHGAELSDLLRTTSLAKIIRRNTGITNIQNNVFFLRDSVQGTVFDGTNDPAVPLPGVTVQLEDDSGNVIATTTTNANGVYRFSTPNAFSTTGDFLIAVLPPDGFSAVSDNPAGIRITRGDINIRNQDFTFVQTPSAPSGTALVLLDQGSTQSQSTPEQGQAPPIGTQAVGGFFATFGSQPTQTVDDGSGVVVVGGMGHEAPSAQTGDVVDQLFTQL